MDLEIKDVAELLNVPETTIHHWLKEKTIPAYRIKQEYRFSRQEIEDWVMGNRKGDLLHSVPHTKDHTHPAGQEHTVTGGNKHFSLYRALHRGHVIQKMPGRTKEEVIRGTTKLVAKDLSLDADVLTELLLDRENLQPTALNNGIGIPHTRDFLLSSHYDVVTIVFPENPLSYGALDNQPVHTLFFLFACDDKRHLHLLAKIAHLSSLDSTLELLRTKPDKEHLLKFIKDWETNLTP